MKSSKNPWPLAIIGGFILFIAGTIGLIVLACSQKMDLVSSDYYEQEIRFQHHIDRERRTAHLAAGAVVAYDAVKHRITIALPAAQARHAILGHIQLYRPSAAGLDRQIQLELNGNGVQSVSTEDLRPGLWKVRVAWTVEGQEFFLDQQVVIGPKA
jgi:nitrogen fixation protein FixH